MSERPQKELKQTKLSKTKVEKSRSKKYTSTSSEISSTNKEIDGGNDSRNVVTAKTSSRLLKLLNIPFKPIPNIHSLLQLAAWEKCLLKIPTVSTEMPEYEALRHILSYNPDIDFFSGDDIKLEIGARFTVDSQVDGDENKEEENSTENNEISHKDENILTHEPFEKLMEERNLKFKIQKCYRENSLDYRKRTFIPGYKIIVGMDVDTNKNSPSNKTATSQPTKYRVRPNSTQLHLSPHSQSREISDDSSMASRPADEGISKGIVYLNPGYSFTSSESFSSMQSKLHSTYVPLGSRRADRIQYPYSTPLSPVTPRNHVRRLSSSETDSSDNSGQTKRTHVIPFPKDRLSLESSSSQELAAIDYT